MKLVLVLALISLALSAGITFAEIEKQMTEMVDSPFVHVMLIFDSSTENGPTIENALKDLVAKKEGYLKLFTIDCNTDDQMITTAVPYCLKEFRSRLPLLNYYEPALNLINPITGQKEEPKISQFKGTLSEKSLFNFAIPLMPLYSVNLRNAIDWKRFQEANPQTPKILYFTDRDRMTPFYKALTAHFRNTIAFAHIFKNSTLPQELGVTDFPTLLLNGKQQVQLTPNILQQVEILKVHKGLPTNITIQTFAQDSSNQLTAENLNEKIYKNPRHILVHVPSADGKSHPEWKKCQQSFRQMFDYFQTFTLATELGAKNLPALIYFPKSLIKKQNKKTIFHPSDSFRTIYDEIASLIDDFTVPLVDDYELQKLTSHALEEDGFIAVLFHKDEISLSYRVLSNDERFKEQITFFRMKNPEPSVLARFKIKKLPTLLVMNKDYTNATKTDKPAKDQEEEEGKSAISLRIAEFTGKYNYDELGRYFTMFIQKKQQEETTSLSEVKQINSKKKFESICQGGSCYLLLLDERPDNHELNYEYVNNLKQASAGINDNIGFIDARCHSQIIQKLQIYSEELPTLVYIDSKFEKYSRLVGTLEEKSILAFVGKVKTKKAAERTYSNLAFVNKDCAKQHLRLKQLEEGGSQMSEQQIKILQEIKLQEERKKKEASAGETQGKKKRRKRRPKEQDSDL